jgi:hypothetical protein
MQAHNYITIHMKKGGGGGGVLKSIGGGENGMLLMTPYLETHLHNFYIFMFNT